MSFEKAPVRSNSKSFPQNSFPHNIVPIFQSQIDELEDSTTFKTVKDVDRKGICYHFDQTITLIRSKNVMLLMLATELPHDPKTYCFVDAIALSDRGRC